MKKPQKNRVEKCRLALKSVLEKPFYAILIILAIFRYSSAHNFHKIQYFLKTDFTADLHFIMRFFWGFKHENLFFSSRSTYDFFLFFHQRVRFLKFSKRNAEKSRKLAEKNKNCSEFIEVLSIICPHSRNFRKIIGPKAYALLYMGIQINIVYGHLSARCNIRSIDFQRHGGSENQFLQLQFRKDF